MNIFNFWSILKKLSFCILISITLPSCTQKNKIPIDQRSSQELMIIEKLKSIFSVPHDQKVKIKKITEGRSDSAIYKAFLNEKNYIVRMLSPERALNERKWEVELVQKTADKNISPHVYYVSPDYQMIIMDCIDGEKFYGSIARNPLLLKSLAQKLRILHSMPVSPLMPKISTLEKNFFVKTEAVEYQEVLKTFRSLEKEFLENSNLAITHTDVHPGNLIADQKNVWIIDWQDAGLYGPLFDLARFASIFKLPIKDEDFFIKAYFGREMSSKEKINYLRAKKMAYIRNIDTLISLYIKNIDKKDLVVKQLFIDSKKDFSLEEKLIIKSILNSNFNEIMDKILNPHNLKILILYLIKNYQKL
ncbi:MAG: phosphotransferase [Alphaproteobacteria bacterium]|nr:phosphotransferase [Alphaproteobacteria bacterium]